MNSLTPEKAEIIGLLCAEGSHAKYISQYYGFFKNRGKNGKYYFRTQKKEDVAFTNLDKDLLEHFIKLMASVYNYSTKVTGVPTSLKVRITKQDIFRDLLQYTDFGCLKWRVPVQLLTSNKETKAAFVRGIFDGDGMFRKSYIRLTSVNIDGLIQMLHLLKTLDIKSKILGPYKPKGNRKLCYYLIIPKSDILKYKYLIKSNHKKSKMFDNW